MKFLSVFQNIFWPTKANHFQPYLLNEKVITILILLFVLAKVLVSFELILIQQSQLFAELNAQKIIALTNEVRQQYGLPPLKENPLLDQAAQAKAQDMLQKNYFAHVSPSGISPWYWIAQAGYRYHYAGENLALNFLDSEEVVRAWLNSPSHRENLLNKNYQEIGVAVLPADPTNPQLNKPLVVQMFGTPQNPKVVTSEINSKESLLTTTTTRVSVTTLTTQSTQIAQSLTEEAVLGEEKMKEETTPAPVSSASVTSTTLVTPTSTKTNIIVESLVTSDLRNELNQFNKIIAFGLIALGVLVLGGILLEQRSIPFNTSELVLRSFIVIFIGISFWAFHLERFIGQLIIPVV
ncbi:MAG: hypothetical protein QG648_61 [Patescibacteria group bacterium]|nr:hypothetical protein [Patescibacteria group bacterium]